MAYYNMYKKSLFAEAEKRKTNKKRVIHRLVCVSTLSDTPGSCSNRRSAVTEYYKQLISKLQRNPQIDVTGILLVYSKCVIHLLESSADVLTLILKNMSEMEEGSDSLLKDSRILVVSHCLWSRMFPSWEHWILDLPLSQKDASPQTHPVELLVTDSLTVIYKLCASLLNYRSNWERQDAQDQTVLLEEENIIHLCQSQVLHSPSTFLLAYTKPVNIIMDSEIVWPTHRRLYWWRE